MIFFDTDILIWYKKGNRSAVSLIDQADEKALALQTYMEFLQGARSSEDMSQIKEFVHEYNFQIFPLTEGVGSRALYYIESYALSHGLRAGDALIAATAVENHMPLATSNDKHFKPIKELKIHLFRP